MPQSNDPIQPVTVRAVKPQLVTSYGNTFAHQFGENIFEGQTKGQIDSSGLSTGRVLEGVEFSEFEAGIYDYVLAKLGHPVIRVELHPFQVKIAIEAAISRMENHAPLWATQFAVFLTTANQGLYELPQYMLNNLTYVVYKKAILSIQSLAGTLEQDFFIRYFQENFIFQDFSVGDFYLLQSHLEMIRKVLGNEGSWNVINNQYLQLYPTPVVPNEEVIIEYRALDSNTIHPAYRDWIKRYALAESKEILGRILGKYKRMPGPSGGAELDGPELRQEAREDKALLVQELLDEFQEPPVFTTY